MVESFTVFFGGYAQVFDMACFDSVNEEYSMPAGVHPECLGGYAECKVTASGSGSSLVLQDTSHCFVVQV